MLCRLARMLETSVRLLRLLSLLQARRDWSGADLAERLGVTTRTVRNDIERLRILGYEVHSSTGITGGYRLGAGSAMPPLLLDDDEAVAVGRRAARRGRRHGHRDRGDLAAGDDQARADPAGPAAAPARRPAAGHGLGGRSRADRRRRDRSRPSPPPAATTSSCASTTAGATARPALRRVEPHRLVYTGRRWYLLGWDRDRADWRTFRADRIRPRLPTGPRFTPREPPEDAASHVVRGTSSLAWRHPARVRLHVPAEDIAELIPPAAGLLTPEGAAQLPPGDRRRLPARPRRMAHQPRRRVRGARPAGAADPAARARRALLAASREPVPPI